MIRVLLAAAVALVCANFVAAQSAAPVLWRDPGAIADKDLTWGPGSAERQPQPPFTFLKEDVSGSKPKVRVRDARGVQWNVKFAGPTPDKNEVHAEVAASRLLWALGYIAEENYFVPQGTIEAVKDLERARASIDKDGSFRNARFERRDPHTERMASSWPLDANPFVGSKELSGLKIFLALVNNWDNKPENTAIDRVTTPSGVEEQYLFSDWGASFGRMSGPPSWEPAPTRWRVDDYAAQPLTRGVENGTVILHYIGQVPMPAIPVDHARWFVDLAAQLRTEQVRAAFAAAGATGADAERFAARFVEKVQELRTTLQSGS